MTAEALEAQPRGSRSSGRGIALLGVALALAGPLVYYGQLMAGWLFVPWYVPALATVGVVLVGVALVRRFTVWRVLGLAVALVLAAGSWHFLGWGSRLPDYAGRVAIGQPFPAFASQRAAGGSFTQADLRGSEHTALVYFRGRW